MSPLAPDAGSETVCDRQPPSPGRMSDNESLPSLEDELPASVPTLSVERLPPGIHKYVSPTSPLALRRMSARGLLPLRPADLLRLLAMLGADPVPEIAALARQSAAAIPRALLRTALADPTLEPRVLHFLARCLFGDSLCVEALAANPSTHDLTVAGMAARTPSGFAIEAIARDHRRLLREPQVLRALLSNPAAPPAIQQAALERVQHAGVQARPAALD